MIFKKTSTTIQEIEGYRPPPKPLLAFIHEASEVWFHPQLLGTGHLEIDKPALYVGNHNLLNTDFYPLLTSVYFKKGIYIRALADRFLFAIPVFNKIASRFGAFEGTPESIREMMQAKQHILVYPGGGREVLKNKGEAYQLFWKSRYGFVQAALEQGYDIIPFVATGGDELLDIHYDSNDFKASRIGKILKKTGVLHYLRKGELFPPFGTGFLNLPFFPKRQQLTYQFFPRIITKDIPPEQFEQAKVEIRNQILNTIETALADYMKIKNITHST